MKKTFILRLVLIVFLLVSFLPVTPVSADKAGVCGAPGKDGPNTALSGIVNSYYPGTASVASGATSIPVGAARTGGGPAIAAGDLLLVVQVQGADINDANTNNYGDGVGNGTINNVNTIAYSAANNYAGGHLATNFSAGNYEYVVAAGAVTAGSVTITSGLTNSYFNADFGTQGQRRYQVIRVPQYSNATLSGTLTAPSWNGSTGGFVVLDVAGQLNWNTNTINVDSLGFRGGGGRQLGGDDNNPVLSQWDFRTLSTRTANGSKGEGYAGTPRYMNYNNALVDNTVEGYPNGSYGRGAGGNGGGGSTDGNPDANDQNSGGGGGGNGGYGGMGGNSWSSGTVNGGYGGAPFPGSAPRLILGGGGGAGTTNNATGTPGAGFASSGAAGGGVVFVRAGTIIGTATIDADGANANNTVENDGGGGGGAGGSVVVVARNGGGAVGTLTVYARGGSGGSTWTDTAGNANRHGPGGGGGGGFVYTSAAVAAASAVTGGANGVTTSGSSAFGATAGGNGTLVVNITPATLPNSISGAGCTTVTPTVTKSTSTPIITQTATGVTGTYTITASVPAASAWASGVVISDTLPSGAPGTITYAATTGIVLTGTGTTRSSTSDPTAGTTTPAWGAFDIAPGGSVAITFTVNFSSTVPAATYQNPAQATYRNPVGTVAAPTLSVSYAPASSTAEDILLRGAADLQITKTDGVTNVAIGAPLTYSVVVTNRGPSAASNTVFTDPVVAGLSVTGVTCGSATGGAACPAPAATTVALMQGAGIVIPTLPANGSVTFTITATVTAVSGSLANTALVATPTGVIDPGVYPNSATDTNTVVSNPQIAVSKTPATQTVVSGSNVAFTLTVTNPGDVALSTVTVTDALCSVGPTRTSGDTNSNNILETTETWVYSCTVNNATADFTNNVSVSGTPPAGAPVTGTGSATVDVIHPAIALDKTPATQTVVSGSNVAFTLTVTNPGDAPLSSVVLTDAQCTTGPTRTSGDTNTNNILETTETWVYSCTVNNATADFTNNASVTANPPVGPAVTDTGSATVDVIHPAILLEKTPATQSVVYGANASFTLTVTNPGDAPLSSVAVTDAQCTTGPTRVSGDTNTNNILETTETWVYSCAVNNVTANFTNNASVSASAPAGPAVNSADTADVTVLLNPQIAVSKTPATQTVVSGSNVTFTLTVTNPGNVPLNTVTVTDAICTTGPTRTSGDTNTNNILETTETWVYSCTVNNATADFTNNVSVSGTPPSGAPVTGTGSATVDVIHPAVQLDITPDTQTVVSGSDVAFTLTVTNPGDTPLSSVVLTDTVCTTGPTLTSGDTNSNGILETSETWVYSCVTDDVTADFTNNASVTANAPAGPAVTDTDSATVDVIQPAILLDITPDTQTVVSGSDVAFTLTVTNPGDVALSSVVLTDTVCTTGPTLTSGDTNANGILETSETWVYSCVTDDVTADFTNNASVSGTPPAGPDVTSADSATVDVIQPAILLDITPDTQTVVSGSDVAFTLTVTNPGDTPLSSVVLTDTVCTTGPTLTSGDTNSNGILETSETWVYSCVTDDVTADFTNNASVTANAPAGPAVTDTDSATVDVIQPAILLDITPDTQTVVSGSDVAFTLTVTNPGDVALSSVVLTDTVCTTGPTLTSGDTNSNGILETSETWVYSCVTDDVTADFTNNASVTANAPVGPAVTDTDSATVDVIQPAILLDITPDTQTVVTGSDVAFTLTVTNPGDSPLSSVVLTDTVCTTGPTLTSGDTNSNGILETSETWVYSCVTDDVTADFTNNASVSASAPVGPAVTDTDSATVDVIQPAILLDITPDTQTVVSGSDVAFTLTVTNPGDVALSSVVLTDTVCTTGPTLTSGDTNSNGILETSETWVYSCVTDDVTADFTNNASVSANAPVGPAVTDTDSATVDVIQPAILLDITPDTQTVVSGSDVAFTLTVTNPGDSPLSSVVLTDTVCTTGPTLTSGDTNSNGILETSETWVYSCVTDDVTADFTNNASVTANAPAGPAVTDTDSATVDVIQPAILLDITPDTQTVVSGSDVAFTLTVTNPGDTSLSSVVLTDTVCTTGPTLTSGDTNSNGILETSETWVYSCVTDDVTADFTNNASVTGTPPAGPNVTSADSATVDVIQPAILLDITPDTQTVVSGSDVAFTLTVTNPGDVALSSVVLTDTVCTTGPTLESGDTNSNGILETTETWVYSCVTDDVTADFTNNASVTANAPAGPAVTDTDSATVDVIQPAILLDITPDTQTVVSGSDVAFTLTVTNPGDTSLSSVVLTDTVCTTGPTLESGDTNSNGILETSETWVYSCVTDDVTADFTNNASVSANAPAGPAVTDTDSATVDVIQPAILLDITPDTQTVVSGSDVAFTLTVTNPGDTSLSSVVLTDTVCTTGPTLTSGDTNSNGILETSETWVYSCVTDDVTADFTNNASVTANAPAGPAVTDTDSATVDVIQPAILLDITPDTQTVVSGSDVAFTLTVTNPGNTSLSSVVLTDTVCTTGPMLVSGDTNSNGILETSETWVYSCVTDDVTVDFTNNASVSGTPPAGPDVTSADSATVDVIQPAILLEKTPATQSVIYDQSANFTLTVTNPGDTSLSNVVVTDVSCTTGPTLVSGDANTNNILETSETWVYSCAVANVIASFTNNASVSATAPAGPAVTSADSANVTVLFSPALTVVKSVTSTGPYVVGDTLTYDIVATNTGNVTLTGVDITDAGVGATLGTCDAVTLVPLASLTCVATHVVTQADVDNGSYVNTATASGTPPTGDPVSDTDGANVAFIRNPELTVVKSVTSTGPYAVGDTLTYDIIATNTGNVTLTNVDITDAGVGATLGTCDAVTLAPGASLTCVATHVVTQADVDNGSYVNTATASGNPPTGDPVSDTDNETVNFVQNPGLTVVKSVTSTGPYVVGDTLTYDIVATNTGNVTLTGVDITDAGVGATLGTCDAVTLAPGASLTCTASHIVTQADVDAASYVNTATASGNPPAGDPVSDTENETVNFPQNPALTVVKSVTSTGPYVVGDTLTYDIVATNSGNVTLTNVDITDAGIGAVLGTCDAVTLAPGASLTCTATHVVVQADVDAASYVNTATASGNPPAGDPVSDTDNETVNFVQNPGLTVVKSVTSTGPYVVGDTITYDIVATNSGSVTLTNVDITDAGVGAVLGTCDAVTLLPGASLTCTASHIVTQADVDAASYVNIATASGTPPAGDPVSDTENETVNFPQNPALIVVKSVTSTGPYVVGDTLTYDIVATNTGNVTLTNVDITDAGVGATLGTCDAVTLLPGASLTCTATHVVVQADVDAASYVNTATGSGNPPTGDPVSDTDNETVNFPQNPALTVIKSVTSTGPYVVGDTITYDIVATNSGNVTLTNVDITDAGVGATLGTCDAVTLVPLASLTCTATHVVTQADADNGSYVNTATASGTPPVGDPVSDTDNETVNFVQNPGLTVVKSVTSTGPYIVGDTITYDIVATNSGNVTLTNVDITDAGVGATLGTCDSVTLLPGASLTCTASHIVTQADVDAASYINIATASGTPPTGDPVSDTENETVNFPQNPALTVIKSVTSTGPYVVGDTITYDIVATNSGNVTLTNVDITDAGVGATLGTCDAVTLLPGASLTCTASHILTQADVDAASYINTATGSGNPPTGDPVSDTDGANVAFIRNPALTVVKSVTSTGPYVVGDTITYDIVATNSGNVTLTNVDITDAGVGATLGTCDVVTLLPGASLTCTASHIVTQADVDNGSYVNTATSSGNPPTGDPVSDTDGANVAFIRNPALTVVKSVTSTGPYVVGDTLTYDIVATNTGNVTLTNVDITDAGTGAVLGTCDAVTLAPGASLTCAATHVVTQTDVDNGSYVNTATASGNPPTGDPVSDTDGANVAFIRNPALTVVKSVTSTGPYVVGDTITYDIIATNSGNVTLTNVDITDAGVGATLGTCDATTLLPGASLTCVASHIVTQADVDAASYVNTATASGTPPTGDPVSDTDNETVNFPQNPALTVVKSVTSTGPYVVGDTLTYDIVATNTGNVTLTNVDITDAGTGAVLGTCDAVTLAPGASLTCAATHVVTQTDVDNGSYVNTATASGNPPTGDPVSDTDGANVAFIRNPALTVVKSVTSTGPYVVGDTLTYDIVATNSGNVTLTNVDITDAGVGAVLGTCDAVTLLPGASLTCTASHIVTQADVDAASYVNTATASGTPPTGDPVSDTDNETVNFVQNPGLTVVKSVTSTGPYVVGDTITYDIVATNSGNVTLTNVDITDAGVGATLGTCDAVTLLPGASLTCTASHIVTQADVDAASYVNTATASGNPPTGDPVSDTENETVNFPQNPGLTVVKSVTSTGPYVVGDTITYDIVATNTGNVTLTNVDITDAGVGATLGTCDAVTLAPGANLTCVATHVVTQADVDNGSYINTATASGTPPTGDPVSDTDNETVNFPQNPALTVVKSVTSTGPYVVGDTLTYDIVATNSGNVTLTNVDITDAGIGAVLGTCDAVTLAPGASLTCTATHVVVQADVDAASYVNTATASGTPPTGDPISDTDDETITFTQTPALTVVKSVTSTGPYVVGDTITYDIVATNSGNVTLTNVDITDAGTGAVLGTCDAVTLAPGASLTCTASHIVTQADVDAASYVNIATASGNPPTGDPVSNTDDASVIFPADPRFTLAKTGTLDMTVVAPPGVANVGDVINYAFTVTNTGNVTLTNITLADTIGGVTIEGGPLATLAPGTSNATTFTGHYTLTAADVDLGSFTNTATASGNPPSGPAVSATDGDLQTLPAVPAITLVKVGTLHLDVVAPDTEVNPGDTITYAFTITNTGNVTLTNITLADTIGGVTIEGGPVLASLDAGEVDNTTFHGTYTITQADINATHFSNTATVSGTPPLGDPVTGVDDFDQPLAGAPALGVAKRVVGVPVEITPGVYEIAYEILVRNYGNLPFSDLQVNDDLAAAFPPPTIFSVESLVSATFAVNPAFNGTSDTDMLLGTDTLAVGASGTLTLTIRVTPADDGPFNNTATATGETPAGDPVSDDSQDGTNPDPDSDGDPTNNNVPTPVDFGPTLYDPPIGVKSVDDNRLPVLRWTVIWINTSNVVAINADSSDGIPTGTTFVDNGIPSGYPLPAGPLPTGSTTNGVACIDNSPATSTTYCYYEGPTTAFPRGRVVWQGTLGPDFGITDPVVARNDIAIRFSTRNTNDIERVNNTATINADRNGDGDTDDPGEIRVASASARWSETVSLPTELPETGFAPGKVTRLPQQPAGLIYQGIDDLKLEIAALKINTNIVGVPLTDAGWQVSWLGNQVGYLEGTSFPTWNGNSVLTAHVYDANGKPGPFVNLGSLKWGDKVVVRAFGQTYTYEVRSVRTQVDPDADVITHEEKSWLTLITCQGYDEKSDSYRWRTVVRAVLVSVE